MFQNNSKVIVIGNLKTDVIVINGTCNRQLRYCIVLVIVVYNLDVEVIVIVIDLSSFKVHV